MVNRIGARVNRRGGGVGEIDHEHGEVGDVNGGLRGGPPRRPAK
jgi:hypothetical protein